MQPIRLFRAGIRDADPRPITQIYGHVYCIHVSMAIVDTVDMFESVVMSTVDTAFKRLAIIVTACQRQFLWACEAIRIVATVTPVGRPEMGASWVYSPGSYWVPNLNLS